MAAWGLREWLELYFIGVVVWMIGANGWVAWWLWKTRRKTDSGGDVA